MTLTRVAKQHKQQFCPFVPRQILEFVEVLRLTRLLIRCYTIDALIQSGLTFSLTSGPDLSM
jgi:hypothetical protein